jgi:serine/threonine-protein kinase
MYEMFTGRLPFDAGTPLDIAAKHMAEVPRPPGEVRPDISPELEAVILKAIAKEPEARFRSGAELADALEHALAPHTHVEDSPPDEPVEAPTTPDELASRLSIYERLAAELAEHPLPPIPAAVSEEDTGSGVSVPVPAPSPKAPSPPEPTEKSDRKVMYMVIGAVVLFLLVVVAVVALFMGLGLANNPPW